MIFVATLLSTKVYIIFNWWHYFGLMALLKSYCAQNEGRIIIFFSPTHTLGTRSSLSRVFYYIQLGNQTPIV